jgi:hypothetical protein
VVLSRDEVARLLNANRPARGPHPRRQGHGDSKDTRDFDVRVHPLQIPLHVAALGGGLEPSPCRALRGAKSSIVANSGK